MAIADTTHYDQDVKFHKLTIKCKKLVEIYLNSLISAEKVVTTTNMARKIGFRLKIESNVYWPVTETTHYDQDVKFHKLTIKCKKLVEIYLNSLISAKKVVTTKNMARKIGFRLK